MAAHRPDSAAVGVCGLFGGSGVQIGPAGPGLSGDLPEFVVQTLNNVISPILLLQEAQADRGGESEGQDDRKKTRLASCS